MSKMRFLKMIGLIGKLKDEIDSIYNKQERKEERNEEVLRKI